MKLKLSLYLKVNSVLSLGNRVELLDLIESNNSVLGSFGEFVYGKICEQGQVEYEISHILETDFRVNCRGKLFEVDVKTTRPHTSFAKVKNIPRRTRVSATTCLSWD